MQYTKIDYLTHAWNPIAMRCTPVSKGCLNCWHLPFAKRHAANGCIPEMDRVSYAGGKPHLKPEELEAPLHRRKPAIIGVQFMGDLFHRSVTSEQIAAMFGVIAATPQHIYMILTKRLERMVDWFGVKRTESQWAEWLRLHLHDNGVIRPIPFSFQWPLPNLWLGVSVEDMESCDRIKYLLYVPAAKKFISYEPAIGPILKDEKPKTYELGIVLSPPRWNPDLVICGAETGPRKRPMDLDWARSVRDQCSSAGVHFWFKKDSDGNETLDGVEHKPEFWR